MNLHKIFGNSLYLFHHAQVYRNHLLCPIERQGQSGFRAAVFPPDGVVELASVHDLTYPTMAEAIEAARRSVDTLCTYWLLGELFDQWQAAGLISAQECYSLRIQLEQWYSATWRGEVNE